MRTAAARHSTAGDWTLARARFVAEALALSFVLLAAGLLIHEAAHLVVIRALGHDGALLGMAVESDAFPLLPETDRFRDVV